MENANLVNNISQPENQQAFNFLNEIYEVMKCFENNPSKLGNRINELKMKFEKARLLLNTIPGIDMSHSEQIEYYESLLKQFKYENELLTTYKDMCQFDLSRLEKENAASTSLSANDSKLKSDTNEEMNI